MRLTTPPLVIDKQDTFKHDLLDRRKFGVFLMSLITRSRDELVIALNVLWGEGRTLFGRMEGKQRCSLG